MVNVGSLPGQANVVFDLDTHSGVMSLLASIRVAELSVAEKNEIRDLVFLYTNGGKEQTVRRALEQKILAHNIVPVTPKVAKQPLPPPPVIGKYRTAPSFSVPSFSRDVVAPSPKPTFIAQPAWKHEEEKITEPAPAPAPAPVPTPAPTPEVTETEVLPVAVSEPVAPQEIPVATPPPLSAPEPVAAPRSADFGDTDAYLQRIREIKALVNEKVGNPVNLVDINNEVGREYMGALLDAMKKINSGSSAASAMKRLEDAYSAVEVALKGRDGSFVAPNPEPVSPVILTPIPQVYQPEPPVPYNEPVYENTTQVTDEPEVEIPEVSSYEPVANPVAINRAPEPIAPIKFAAFETAPEAPAAFEPSEYTAPRPVAIEPLGTPATPPPPQQTYFSSLADYGEKSRITNPLGVSNTSQKAVAVATGGDPLSSPEVDDGLQQLLSEWSIYKKSGLFGTGPKGREHPLFKKMAPLQIPLLLAGRFEGATQEVKQSVTDYMNGWRYEQGLIYQQNETFEHYLRRVIRHILDLQKG